MTTGARAGETSERCHLCRREFLVDEMGRDLDGDLWCRDWIECNRIARQRLGNPDAVWRKRREVARLKWEHDEPTVEEMFELVVDTVALFGLDGPASTLSVEPVQTTNGTPPVQGWLFE